MYHKKPIKLFKQKKKFDLWIAVISLFFSLFGILMIYEASNVVAFRDFADKYYFVREQLIWFVIGTVALILTSFISYKRYYTFSVPLIILTILSLMLVLVPNIGIKALGAQRRILLGSFGFQPSELAKITLIVYLSSWFASPEKRRLFAFLLLLSIIVGLVLLQPDLGTAVILTAIFIIMYFLSGASLWQFIVLLPMTGIALGLLTITSSYRLQRLTTFLNPNFDPLGASYHIRQILIAFGSGGFWGLGLGASRQKYQFLPEATTDSIFAIIGEEFGFIGALIFIIFFLFLLYRMFQVVRHAPDRQGYLLGSGILALFSCQTLINLGSMVAFFPLTGVPLPFISYGGSNLIVSLIAIGIMLNISRHSVHKT